MRGVLALFVSSLFMMVGFLAIAFIWGDVELPAVYVTPTWIALWLISWVWCSR